MAIGRSERSQPAELAGAGDEAIANAVQQAGTVTLSRPAFSQPGPEYLEVTSPTIAPTTEFWFSPISESRMTIPVYTFTPSYVADGAKALGVDQDPMLGAALVEQYDCRLGLSPAPGVTFALSPPGSSQIVYYSKSGRLGAGAFIFNIPVTSTPVMLTATLSDAGPPVAELPIFVRPGGVAVVAGLPTQ